MADHGYDDVDGAGDNMAYLALEDKANRQTGRGRGGGGGRSRARGGRSGGGGGNSLGRDVQISKSLSKLLRHQAENAGIPLDNEGYAPLDQVLQWGPIRALKVTMAEIHTAVADNAKQRFSLKPNPATNPSLDETAAEPSGWLIRANQGHSIKVDSSGLLRPLGLGDVPERVVHGTFFAFWPLIVASGGLKRMGRNHVHCSAGVPGQDAGVVSGMRGDAELLVYVDVAACVRDGMKWWVSDNGVLLTEGEGEDGLVSSRYFSEVAGRRGGVGLLWKDGEKVADLPEGLRARAPQGKQRAATSSRGGGRGGGGGRGKARADGPSAAEEVEGQ